MHWFSPPRCRRSACRQFPIFASGQLLGDGREVDFTLHGHKGLTAVCRMVCTAVFCGATNPAIWILLGVYYVRLFTFRAASIRRWMLALFPIFYVLILSFSPKTNHRYFLPDTLIFCTLAAFGLFCFTLGGSARLTRAVQADSFLTAFGISVATLFLTSPSGLMAASNS
jgi:hypothetical protein